MAQLNPKMWCELFLDDADNLAREIEVLIDALASYRDAIVARDGSRLEALLAEGDRIKRADVARSEKDNDAEEA